jgi:hypothetical protein
VTSNKAIPWLIGLLAVLLVVAAVLAFLLIRQGDDPGTPAAQTTPSEQSTSSEPTSTDQGATPSGEEPYTDEGGSITGSADRGAAFMDEVVLGQFENALGHGGTDFQAYYDGDAGLLEEEIITAAGGAAPVTYTIDGVGYNSEVDADVLSLTVEQPDGTLDDMVVLVGEEGTSTVVVGFQ